MEAELFLSTVKVVVSESWTAIVFIAVINQVGNYVRGN